MYTAYFIKTSSSVVVTATLGTVSGDSIINIPSDSTPTVTATLTGCSSATVVKLPSKACAVCIAPVLTVGSATCSGSSYEFTFTTNASQGITTTAGTVSGDKVIGVPKNIAVTITASNGTGCSTVLKVNTPNTDCPNNSTACVTPKLVAGNGVCNGSTWEFSFTEITGALISVSSGTISGNKVIGIAVGTNVTIIASNNPTCVVSLNVSSPANCSSTDPCEKQLISIGGTKCNATGTAYSIFFTKSSASVVVTSKFGTVSGDSIINIPNGKIDTVFASLPGCLKSVAIPVKSKACLGFEANIDNSKVTSGGSKSINVSTNDNLTASSNYKFKVGTNPKKGTVVIDSVTGIATYKSTDTSYKGIDSFTYTVTDPITGEVKTAMVYVTVGNPDNIDVVVPEGNGKEVDGEDYSDNNLSIKTKNYTVNTNPSNGTISDFDPATGAFKYTPTPGKCGKDSTRIMVVYTYAESGKTADTFFYMVRFNVPCSSNDIPNYITPNGDGINDVFVIPNFATKYRNAKLMIYNRWGNIVWRSYGSYQNNWSGSHYDGQPLPDGVYYYMIENEVDKDLVQPVTGFIQIGRD
jgi:gliding motility-associated-like protein